MKVTTTPSCRVGSEGQTLEYIVRAEGATELVVPESTTDAFQVRLLDSRQVGDGVEGRLAVTVLDSTPY